MSVLQHSSKSSLSNFTIKGVELGDPRVWVLAQSWSLRFEGD